MKAIIQHMQENVLLWGIALLFALYGLVLSIVHYNETNNAEVLAKLDQAESIMDEGMLPPPDAHDGLSKWVPGNPVAERYKAQVARDEYRIQARRAGVIPPVRGNADPRKLFAAEMSRRTGLNIWANNNALHIQHSRGARSGGCGQLNSYMGGSTVYLRAVNFNTVVIHADNGTFRCRI